MEVRGVDEAFLDLSKYCNNNYITTRGELESIVNEIKHKIYDQTKLTCSIGISSNKMLAKICSDKNKPDGCFILLTDNIDEIILFMSNMNIRKVPFVGEKTEQKLNLLGIKTCNDFLEKFVELFYILHDNIWEFLIGSCLGIGITYHEDSKEIINKSVSCSESFKMTNDFNKIRSVFESLVKRLYSTMIEDQVIGKNLGLEIKDKNDRLISRSISLKKYYETENEIRNNGWNTLYLMIQNTSIRLIRLKLSSLTTINPEQLKKKKDNPILKFFNKINTKNSSTNKNCINDVKIKYQNDSELIKSDFALKRDEQVNNHNLEKNKKINLPYDENYLKERDLSKVVEETFNNKELDEKNILKMRNNKINSNNNQNFFKENNKTIYRTRELNESNKKIISVDKKNKKESKIDLSKQKYMRLNDLLENMKNSKSFSDIKIKSKQNDLEEININNIDKNKIFKVLDGFMIENNYEYDVLKSKNKINELNINKNNKIIIKGSKNQSKGKNKGKKKNAKNKNQIKIDDFLLKNLKN